MNINYLQIAIGIIIGIFICIQFPNVPNQLKQMSKNFEKQQEEKKTAEEIVKEVNKNEKNKEIQS